MEFALPLINPQPTNKLQELPPNWGSISGRVKPNSIKNGHLQFFDLAFSVLKGTADMAGRWQIGSKKEKILCLFPGQVKQLDE